MCRKGDANFCSAECSERDSGKMLNSSTVESTAQSRKPWESLKFYVRRKSAIMKRTAAKAAMRGAPSGSGVSRKGSQQVDGRPVNDEVPIVIDDPKKKAGEAPVMQIPVEPVESDGIAADVSSPQDHRIRTVGRVRFGEITFHTHERQLFGGCGVPTDGPSIGLGWNVAAPPIIRRCVHSHLPFAYLSTIAR